MEQRIPNNIWPMAQIMQGKICVRELIVLGLTTDDVEEKLNILDQLLSTDAGTGHMHESYDVNNPASYTRRWFCWADALFAEFLLSLTRERCEGPMPSLQGLTSSQIA